MTSLSDKCNNQDTHSHQARQAVERLSSLRTSCTTAPPLLTQPKSKQKEPQKVSEASVLVLMIVSFANVFMGLVFNFSKPFPDDEPLRKHNDIWSSRLLTEESINFPVRQKFCRIFYYKRVYQFNLQFALHKQGAIVIKMEEEERTHTDKAKKISQNVQSSPLKIDNEKLQLKFKEQAKNLSLIIGDETPNKLIQNYQARLKERVFQDKTIDEVKRPKQTFGGEPSITTNREGDEDCIELENYHQGQEEDEENIDSEEDDKQLTLQLTPSMVPLNEKNSSKNLLQLPTPKLIKGALITQTSSTQLRSPGQSLPSATLEPQLSPINVTASPQIINALQYVPMKVLKYHGYVEHLKWFIERTTGKNLSKLYPNTSYMQPNNKVNKFKVIYQKDTNQEAYNHIIRSVRKVCNL